MKSDLEESLARQIKLAGLPLATREYRFHPTRRWRLDLAWPEHKVGVECEGGTWISGRHNRGAGIEKDMEKYNAAALDGWLVFRYTARHIENGYALEQLESVLGKVTA